MEERKRRWRIKQNYNLMGVYSITNRTNGKVYVGSSTKLMERLKQHERSLMAGKHPVKALQQAEGHEQRQRKLCTHIDVQSLL